MQQKYNPNFLFKSPSHLYFHLEDNGSQLVTVPAPYLGQLYGLRPCGRAVTTKEVSPFAPNASHL
ncbi:hypothetical protein I79_003829 [Cricetulus griseus]|uniref:Uncharacterized protein n=1 Tax=Cricetulus griseus TaxID=10029 RepID=G3H109_CRIGR|nr:hypothetical protein I79_003829 [Cricetulus griseus]